MRRTPNEGSMHFCFAPTCAGCPRACPELRRKVSRVPHPFALFAKGWGFCVAPASCRLSGGRLARLLKPRRGRAAEPKDVLPSAITPRFVMLRNGVLRLAKDSQRSICIFVSRGVRRLPGACPELRRRVSRVPHPFALFAKGWGFYVAPASCRLSGGRPARLCETWEQSLPHKT